MQKSGESRAEWVQRALAAYERPLIAYARRITGDLETARDAVQDTFLRLCRADRTQVDGHLAAWLYTVCRNRALDIRKKDRRMSALADGQAERIADHGPSPAAVATANETHARLLEAIDALPAPVQEAFRLKLHDGLTYREIAAIMGVSLGTVSNHITAALTTVRARMRADEPAREA